MNQKRMAVGGSLMTGLIFLLCFSLVADGPPAPPGMDDDGGGSHGGAHTFSAPDPGVGGTNSDPGVPTYNRDYSGATNVYLFPPISISTNSISLTLTNGGTNGVYDLFATTNLSPYADGLNLTNWIWVTRGAAGQTNFVLTNLNIWPKEAYFQLGNTQDSDGDGLTDAYEILVSHTDPYNADNDGDGLPDAWELAHGLDPRSADTGNTGVPDGYKDPDGDGWSNLEEYQNGTDPNAFNTPRAVSGFTANGTGGTAANLSWQPSPGAVTGYVIYRGNGFTNVAIATNTSSQLTYNDSAMPNGGEGISYQIVAQYATGPSHPSDWNEALIEPRYTTPAVIVSGPGGSLNLIVSSIPAGVTGYRVHKTVSDSSYYPLDFESWNRYGDVISNSTDRTFDIPVTNFVNGIATFTNTEINPFGIYNISVQAIGQDGKLGRPIETTYNFGYNGVGRAMPFMDGTAQLKQNLSFLMRSSVIEPFVYGFGDHDFPFGGNFFSYPTNYLYADYYDPLEYRNEFRPFEDNSGYRNFVFDTNLLTGSTVVDTGLWATMEPFLFSSDPRYFFPTYTYVASSNLQSIPPLLATNNSRYLLSAVQDAGWDWDLFGIYSDPSGWHMTNGARTYFGLPILSCQWPVMSTGMPFQTLSPTHSATNFLDGDNGVYTEVEPPVFRTVDYYFARPGIDPKPGDISPYTDLDFQVTNQTPLIILRSGQPITTIAGYAKQVATNANTNVFAYLGQYFDKAYTTTNGVRTTNETGILSEYGDFFPTEPGKIILTTKPDLDRTNLQGECAVYVIRLSLDVNHDGIMDETFTGPDNTSADRPFTFWVNDDNDGTGDGQDLPLASPEDADYTYHHIRSIRGLEDFTRLWITGMPVLSGTNGYSVSLSWNNTVGNPAINLYVAYETNGGIAYLTNTTTASAMTNQIALGVVSNTVPFTFASGFFTNEGPKHFLFEGAGIGSGELVLEIDKNGTNVAATSVFMNLKKAKDMYERVTITNVLQTWPDMVQESRTSRFEVVSSPPPDPTEDKQVAVFVHGWRMTQFDYDSFSQSMFKRLYWQGFNGRFASVRWPTRSSDTDADELDKFTYNRSEYISFQSANGAASYFDNLRERYTNYTISVCAHSQGNILMMQSLHTFIVNNETPLDNYVMMQAALPAHCYDTTITNLPLLMVAETNLPTPNTYSNYAAGASNAIRGTIVNFFNPVDFALEAGRTNIGGFELNISWEGNESLLVTKPLLFFGYGYSISNATAYISSNTYTIAFGITNLQSRFITNKLELMPFVARPRSKAVGAQGGIGNSIATMSEINLTNFPFGFTDAQFDHSGQFNRNIQESPVWPFYKQLRLTLFP